jgi:glutamate-5-semialdehyde dehydrogenase
MMSARPEQKAEDLREAMLAIGRAARAAARDLALASTATKNAALCAMAAHLRQSKAVILKANAADVGAAKEAALAASFIDRLTLTDARIEAIARGLEEIAELADPIGATLSEWTRPNGLRIARVRVPIGVIGIIYESRPNVTADAGGLCVKAGNAAILRTGSDAFQSASAIHACLVSGLKAAGLPEQAIQLIPTTSRSAVGHLLSGLEGTVDVIVPRGGRSLVERVQQDARVPVFAHLEGICHTYVDKAADLDMAKRIVVNAKMRRTGICGATECLLVDTAAPKEVMSVLVAALLDAGCEVRGDEAARAADSRVKPVAATDYGKEFLDSIIAVKAVDGVEGAIDHIARFGSQHTDAIVTADEAAAARFLTHVDSAIVLHNASTQFADGGEFGFGAEIGIATGKMHARGPVGVEQLTSFKYVVRGSGQTRPG